MLARTSVAPATAKDAQSEAEIPPDVPVAACTGVNTRESLADFLPAHPSGRHLDSPPAVADRRSRRSSLEQVRLVTSA